MNDKTRIEDKKKMNFNEWMSIGLEKGFIQEIDKQMRIQYNIKQEPEQKHWDEAEKYFCKKKIERPKAPENVTSNTQRMFAPE